MADLTNDIATQAIEPASMSADGQSASARSIPDMVTAQQMLDMKTAVRKRRRGIVFGRLTAPGAADDAGRTFGGFGNQGGY